MATAKRHMVTAKRQAATARPKAGDGKLLHVAQRQSSATAALAIDPTALARELGITKADLADTLGLPADALLRQERIAADKTQARLSELVEILKRVEAWSGGVRPAFAWYRSAGIPALGDETAEALVKTNRAGHVRTYLNAIAAGGFA